MSQDPGMENSDAAIHWNGYREGIEPTLAEALEAGARKWHAATGYCVEVTSGRRTLRHQAKLMAAMSDAQLTALYGSRAIPDYVHRIRELRESGGMVSVNRVYDILRKRGEGYVSRHLFGGAVDLAVPISCAAQLVCSLEQTGLAVLDERAQGIHCLHVSLPELPIQVIRE